MPEETDAPEDGDSTSPPPRNRTSKPDRWNVEDKTLDADDTDTK